MALISIGEGVDIRWNFVHLIGMRIRWVIVHIEIIGIHIVYKKKEQRTNVALSRITTIG